MTDPQRGRDLSGRGVPFVARPMRMFVIPATPGRQFRNRGGPNAVAAAAATAAALISMISAASATFRNSSSNMCSTMPFPSDKFRRQGETHRNPGSLASANMWLRRAAVTLVAGLLTTLSPPVAVADPELQAAVNAPKGPAPIWLVADLVSGRILGAKDAYGQHAPASTIKPLLAMVVMDQVNPDSAIRATQANTDVSAPAVGIGRRVPTWLLDALLMVSGNDAANALADMLGGYQVAIQKMNAKAAQIGAVATRAGSPSGLDGPGWEDDDHRPRSGHDLPDRVELSALRSDHPPADSPIPQRRRRIQDDRQPRSAAAEWLPGLHRR